MTILIGFVVVMPVMQDLKLLQKKTLVWQIQGIMD